jgi:hypothetical protein
MIKPAVFNFFTAKKKEWKLISEVNLWLLSLSWLKWIKVPVV